MKPKLYMLVGLPASGKSTYAKTLDGTIFSSDALRAELWGDESTQGDNNKLFIELHRRIKDCLRSGQNAIYDATNINYKKRMAFLQELKHIDCEKICIFVAVPYDECVKRNRRRDRVVPEHIIERMYKNFECPYYFEGWNDIQIIYPNNINKPNFNRGAFESMAINYMKGFNQNSPHHIHDVWNHSKALMFQFPKGDVRRISAMLHDCMKKKAETQGEDGVSHYYNHANMSAYYVLTHPNIVDCDTTEEMLEVVFYITYHMLAHDINTNKNKAKYKNIFGNELYNKLIEFAAKDTIASNQAIFNIYKNNIYIMSDNYFIGYTRDGHKFFIDKEDLPIVFKYTWCVKSIKNKDYRLVSMSDGKAKFLHRIIMNIEDADIVVDHINHNQLDNRKFNLRLCTRRENSYNCSLSTNNTSGVNGVSKMNNGKYRAYINLDYKQIHIGVYDTLKEAMDARNHASQQYYGEFANLSEYLHKADVKAH